jgi:hypothetical protein
MRFDDLFSSAGTSTRRSIAAFIAAPLVGTYVYGLLLCVAALFYRWPQPAGEVAALVGAGPLFIVLFGAMLSYPGIVLVGLPTWLLLRWARTEGLVPYTLAGVVGGTLLPPAQRGWSFVGEPHVLHNQVAGALVMATFWLIARRRTPRSLET